MIDYKTRYEALRKRHRALRNKCEADRVDMLDLISAVKWWLMGEWHHRFIKMYKGPNLFQDYPSHTTGQFWDEVYKAMMDSHSGLQLLKALKKLDSSITDEQHSRLPARFLMEKNAKGEWV